MRLRRWIGKHESGKREKRALIRVVKFGVRESPVTWKPSAATGADGGDVMAMVGDGWRVVR